MLRVQLARRAICCSARRKSNASSHSKRTRRHKRNGLHLQRGLLDYDAKDIQICETVQNIALQDHTPPFHEEGCLHEHVAVTLDAQRCSGGYFIRGNVSVKLQFRCMRCSSVFEHPIDESFEIWANPKIRSWDECIDVAEVPFPPVAGYLDLTEPVTLAIGQGFPRFPFCGQSACVSTATSGVDGSEWPGWETPSIPHANAFSCLKDFKDILDDAAPSKKPTSS